MDVGIICIGKLKEAYWRDACAEYAKRLSAHCRFSIIELAEAHIPKDPSDGDIRRALSEEGARILDRCPAGAWVAALCIEGDLLTSEKLAERMASAAIGGKSSMYFIIGGSHGLAPEVTARANARISMGRMTFPHQLARVMVCEQIYRAFAINSGSRYHK